MLVRETRIRRWTILFLFSYGTKDEESVQSALVWAGAPHSLITHVSGNISAGRLNEGFCFSDPVARRTVAAIGEAASGPEFLNTTVHEITHIAQDIARAEGLDPWGEDIAYLAGEISRKISDIVCEMSCPHCRGGMSV